MRIGAMRRAVALVFTVSCVLCSLLVQAALPTVALRCPEDKELTLTFSGPAVVLEYEVTLPAGGRFQAWVKDLGAAGDKWQAEILEAGRLLATVQGDGSVTRSSGPASAAIPSGKATVRVRYLSGNGVWPSLMNLSLRCDEGVQYWLRCSDPLNSSFKSRPTFQNASEASTHGVELDRGFVLSVEVKAVGSIDYKWRAEIFENGNTTALASVTTEANGNLTQYSSPVYARIASGKATIRITHISGGTNWPTQAEFRITCSDKFQDQPDGWSSSLSASSGGAIYDFMLANAIKRHIADPGYANMFFVFNECFGGGMIDNLVEKLEGTGDAAFMSASRSNETSKGAPDNPTQWYKDRGFAVAENGFPKEVGEEIAKTGDPEPTAQADC